MYIGRLDDVIFSDTWRSSRCDDTPIVYDSLRKEHEDGDAWLLCYAGGRISTEFDPAELTFSKTTGRM